MFKQTCFTKKGHRDNEKNKIKPKIKKLSLQQADIIKTHGNNKKLIKLINKIKYTPVNQSILNTKNWYKNYYQKK